MANPNAGHFFQTSESLVAEQRKANKAQNKLGRPIKLSSKLLAVTADPFDTRAVYVAEAAGEVRRVVLETGEKISVDKATAPLTSLAFSPNGQRMFSGCWDKNIYSTDFETGQSQTFSGHGDFVKCLITTTISNRPILLSGSADATIIVWDLNAGVQLHKLKGHVKAVLDLAIDPLSLPEDPGMHDRADGFVLFSASSDREIRRWYISLARSYEIPESLEKPLRPHETSVWALRFDNDGDLWTASADKTAKHLVRSRGWEADAVLQHNDFVGDVLPFDDLGLVVTACRDEEVRVWDVVSGNCVCVYEGHYEEVTGLARVGRNSVVSVSIDSTVRRWSLDRNEMINFVKERERAARGEDDDDDIIAGRGKPSLTAEEEDELAELMDDSD